MHRSQICTLIVLLVSSSVYAETLEEAQPAALQAVAPGTSAVSLFFFVRLPDAVAVGEARRCLRCDLETEAGKQALRELDAAPATAG